MIKHLTVLYNNLIAAGFFKTAEEISDILQDVMKEQIKQDLLDNLIEKFDGILLAPDPDTQDLRIQFENYRTAKKFQQNAENRDIVAHEPIVENDKVIVYISNMEQENNDMLANLTGLREDGTLENMNQGYSLPNFYTNFTNLD